MQSKILGRLNLETSRLKQDLETLFNFPYQDQYSEFTFGHWFTHVLWNPSGDHNDRLFRTYEGHCRKTALAEQLPYLCKIVENNFDQALLRWARVFVLSDGLLISHRDFVEFDKPLLRLNLPISTRPDCLHSEANHVFHMREGEIWFLDATQVHSALSPGHFKRALLVLDFDDIDGAPLEQLIAPEATSQTAPPHIVQREKMDDRCLQAMYGLGNLLTKQNFRDVIRLLAKTHFYRDSHAEDCFDWLVEVARRSNDAQLLTASEGFRRYCIEQRHIDERFDLEFKQQRDTQQ